MNETNPEPIFTVTDSEIQRAFAQHTLNVEARRDRRGRLVVYPLPPGDGGGTYEVAGINDRYHPRIAARLRDLIAAGRHAEAEQAAVAYLDSYTSAVDEWHPDETVEGFLRCCAFNRGPKGAGWMLQYALRYGFTPALYPGKLDGSVGPATRAAAAKADAETLLPALYGARIVYERTKLPWKGAREESSPFWHGLFRRFTNDLTFALSLRP